MNVSDKVFCGNMCFICHATIKEGKLKTCSFCKMVSYCSENHQKIHWKRHDRLCKIIQKLALVLQPESMATHQDWFIFRTKFLKMSEFLLKRELKPSEVSMILFPNNCQICHKITDLEACPNCLCINYCSEDHKQADLPLHKNICHLFALCLKLDLYLEKKSICQDYQFGEIIFTPNEAITAFMDRNISLWKNDSVSLILQKALLSELITCPLSLLYAIHLMKYQITRNVVLHIVGCSFLETNSLKSWELITHAQPEIDHLEIHFIGPEVKRNHNYQFCRTCQKKLKFKYFKGFYHEYLESIYKVKPSIICTFNSGYHEYENTDSDTWKETLPYLVKNEKIPLIFTSFTEKEAVNDFKRLLKIDKNLKVMMKKNPFRSLRPYRDLENSGIYFNNEYLSTVLR